MLQIKNYATILWQSLSLSTVKVTSQRAPPSSPSAPTTSPPRQKLRRNLQQQQHTPLLKRRRQQHSLEASFRRSSRPPQANIFDFGRITWTLLQPNLQFCLIRGISIFSHLKKKREIPVEPLPARADFYLFRGIEWSFHCAKKY